MENKNAIQPAKPKVPPLSLPTNYQQNNNSNNNNGKGAGGGWRRNTNNMNGKNQCQFLNYSYPRYIQEMQFGYQEAWAANPTGGGIPIQWDYTIPYSSGYCYPNQYNPTHQHSSSTVLSPIEENQINPTQWDKIVCGEYKRLYEELRLLQGDIQTIVQKLQRISHMHDELRKKHTNIPVPFSSIIQEEKEHQNGWADQIEKEEQSKKKTRCRRGLKKGMRPQPKNVEQLFKIWNEGKNNFDMKKPLFYLQEKLETEGVHLETGDKKILKRFEIALAIGDKSCTVKSEEGVWFETGRRAKNDVALQALLILNKCMTSSLCNTTTTSSQEPKK